MSDVASATDTIQDNLHQHIFDWDVTRGELTENSELVASLTPEERNELVSNLSDDELKNWTQEIDGLNGSLTANERQELYNDLAEGLDGEQLTRLVEAFDGSPGGRQALGDAVAAHASPEAKIAFIDATKDSIDGEYSATLGRDGNAETVVIAKVLASLSGDQAAFDEAIKSLSQGQLEDVLAVGLGRNYVADPTGYTAGTYYFEPSAALGIIEAAANSSDVQVKGAVFAAATEHFNTLEGQTPDAAYTEALTQLIQSDPSGLVNELQSRTDVTGGSLAAYAKEMINSGNEQDLQNLLVQMQQGNDGTGNAFENFSDPAFARNLGFMTGAIAAAINSITGDAQAQADMLGNIFGVGFGLGGMANPPAGVIATVGNGITSAIISDIIDGVAEGNTDLKQAMYELAIPRGEEGEVNMAGTGYDAFNASFAAVAELHS